MSRMSYTVSWGNKNFVALLSSLLKIINHHMHILLQISAPFLGRRTQFSRSTCIDASSYGSSQSAFLLAAALAGRTCLSSSQVSKLPGHLFTVWFSHTIPSDGRRLSSELQGRSISICDCKVPPCSANIISSHYWMLRGRKLQHKQFLSLDHRNMWRFTVMGILLTMLILLLLL